MIKQIIFLIILAVVIRSLFIFSGAISFHYDMSRDAFEAQQIWKDKNLKIIGPPTTSDGLFSGVFYYYLLAMPYGVSSGDPTVAAAFLAVLNSLAIIPLFFLAKDLFKSKSWAFLAGLIYAVSFEAVQYGPWLSNPGPAVFTMAMFFYSLRLWQKGNNRGLPLAVIFAALSAQLEFFLLFLFVVIIAFKFLFKLRTSIKHLIISIILSVILLSTFIISTFKFNTFTQTITAFFRLFQNIEFSFRIKFTDLLSIYTNRFADLFINNFFPNSVFIGGLLGFSVLFILLFRQKINISGYKFILFCLLSNLPIFIGGGQNATYTMVGMSIPAILGICALLQNISKLSYKWTLAIIVLILLSNIYMTYKLRSEGQVALVIPKDMILKNQLSIVDKTYEVADGKPFSINSLTLPLWTNTTWAYLYSWYGQKKYGYLPEFTGHNQVGLLGAETLRKVDNPADKSFFIIEPHVGIPPEIYNLEIGAEDAKTKMIEQISYGDLKLQIRKPLINNE